jgi:uncharacterized membrane protein
MRKFPRSLVVMLLVVLIFVAGAFALVNMEVPAPAQPYEKQINLSGAAQ